MDVPTSLEEVTAFFVAIQSTALEGKKFYHHYVSNGWQVGRTPMKNWKAAVESWLLKKSQFELKKDNHAKLHVNNDKNYGEPL